MGYKVTTGSACQIKNYKRLKYNFPRPAKQKGWIVGSEAHRIV